MKVVSGFYVPKVGYKEVPGYKGHYEVDSLGRVYSVKSGERFEMSKLDEGRYVNLCKDGVMQKCSVAYLVARAFLPNSEMRPYVRHKDGNVSNNSVENLEWSEEKDKRMPRKGASGARRVMCVTAQGDVFEFESATKAAEEMMVSRKGILKCISGKQQKCGGFKWYEI